MKVQLNSIRAKSTWEGKEPENHSPASNYCRKLLEEGIDPKEKLEVYRGEQLAYSMTIGEAAKWKVLENRNYGPKFIKWKENPFKLARRGKEGVASRPYSDLNEEVAHG